jgi:hypothetical protein
MNYKEIGPTLNHVAKCDAFTVSAVRPLLAGPELVADRKGVASMARSAKVNGDHS